jgi:hypothetical protein
MTGLIQQLAALQRIAAFSAKVRGHHLTAWKIHDYSATAACSKCGRSVTVYPSVMEPEMDGPALSEQCGEPAAEQAA